MLATYIYNAIHFIIESFIVILLKKSQSIFNN